MRTAVYRLRRVVAAICVGSIVMGAAPAAFADPLTAGRPIVLAELFPNVSGYDPVAHALALGLTPEAVDAAVDKGLSSAERCGSDSSANTVGCPVQTSGLPSYPMS